MAELSTIARPYAEALFETARASGERLDDWLAAIEDLAASASHPQVAQMVADPRLADEQIYALLVGLLKSEPHERIASFLKLLIANQRIAVLPEVASQFRQLKNEVEGVADCLIESAFPMGEPDVRELLAALSHRFGRKLQPTVKVDPTLIGGVRISVGDRVLDGSVRAQLQAMQAALTV